MQMRNLSSNAITETIKTTVPNSKTPCITKIKHVTMCHATNIPFTIRASLSKSSSTRGIPTMEDILNSSRAQKLDIKLQTLGPFFRITAENLETKAELGRAEGLIRLWLDGKILHLDSIRLRRETMSMQRSIFGVGLFIGAVAIRHGYDYGCDTAQLLAINDTELYHSKLVKFYSRVGFNAVHEVDGSSLGDLAHILVWGGRGTRMDANIKDLLVRWSPRFQSRN